MIEDTITKRNEYNYISAFFDNNNLLQTAEQIYNIRHPEIEEVISNDVVDIRNLVEKKTVNIIRMLYHLNCKFMYINSGSTGHFFKIVMLDNDGNKLCWFGMKVTMYDINSLKHMTIYDASRPENVEVVISMLLKKLVLKGEIQHIILLYKTFYTNIETFLALKCTGDDANINDDKQRYRKFVENAKKEKYSNKVSINLYEYANSGDFLNFLKNEYKTLSLIEWKTFFFQIISTLAVIHVHYPTFRHNDFKANNILVHKIKKNSKYVNYTICGKNYKTPNVGYTLKICDFDFASIDGVINNIKVNLEWANKYGINCQKNLYYDIHYLFNSLINVNFFPQILTDNKYCYSEIKEFIYRIIPPMYRTHPKCNERGRLMVSDEYMSPQGIIENDILFEDFR